LESRRKKSLELGVGHPVAFDLEMLFCVTLVVHVIRHIGEDEVCGLTSHQPGDVVAIGCVSNE